MRVKVSNLSITQIILDKDAIIYMGKDKFENEELIKYALPHDIWFHVDEMSSAHVYLRMKEPITSYD